MTLGGIKMKTLHLLRHAKSSWNNPDLNDHDRPLNKRGRRTAETIAAYFQQAKIAPDVVICSTAVRALQTLDPIAKAKKPRNVVIQRGIYEGMQQTMWEQLRKLPNNAKCVLLIGHNPSLHDLALTLVDAEIGQAVAATGRQIPNRCNSEPPHQGSLEGVGAT